MSVYHAHNDEGNLPTILCQDQNSGDKNNYVSQCFGPNDLSCTLETWTKQHLQVNSKSNK